MGDAELHGTLVAQEETIRKQAKLIRILCECILILRAGDSDGGAMRDVRRNHPGRDASLQDVRGPSIHARGCKS